ncbi:MAG: hypothetical protein U1E33_08915 [Rhodospirillales bacterium]
MTQALDLGAIANQLAALYRARVNANIQALATQHYGATEPPMIYPNLLWFDSGTGSVKLRDPTNTNWWTVGTIGPPMKWTNVDIPQTAFTTGDVKQTFRTIADPGWVMMNDGSIGDGSSGATTRANPDAEALFSLLWANTSDAWCKVLAAGGSTPTGRGASAAADWVAHRHILLPKVLGRVLAVAGWGAGLSNFALATWQGAEFVGLGLGNLPAHTHSFGVPAHTHTVPGMKAAGPPARPAATAPIRCGRRRADGAGGGFSGNTGSAGSGEPHFNIQPTCYLNVMVKL